MNSERLQRARTRHGLDGPGCESRYEEEIFSLLHKSQTVSGIRPASCWKRGYFVEVKRPERDVDRSPPSNAEVMNKWSCTSVSPIYRVFHDFRA